MSNNEEQIEGVNGEYCECCGAWIEWEKKPAKGKPPEPLPLEEDPFLRSLI